MALRIIKVDKTAPEHWDYAERNGFWDLTQRDRLEEGDDVVFWRNGSPGTLLGQARVAGPIEPLPQDSPHAWSPGDSRRGRYKFRVPLVDFLSLDGVKIQAAEFRQATGVTIAQQNVIRVPAEHIPWFTQRAGLVLEQVPRAFAQAFKFLEEGEVEPTRYDDDERRRIPATIVLRRGARKFRRALMAAYSGECAVTGTSLEGLLDAAHISRYRGDHTDRVENGLLLRTDIHTLFDLHLLTVLPDLTVRVAPEGRIEPYAALDGRRLAKVPEEKSHRPQPELLQKHNAEFEKRAHGSA